ncbi:MAG: hypothetical protein JOZ75_10620 [Candidatus Dormibacteraeota bacterium]|nr:hypothetical protein [Candidatus Dormibacteraeota bacterium]
MSRRGFIGGSVGAAAGAATMGPLGIATSLGVAAPLAAPLAAGAVLAFVRPGSRGELSLMVGDREISVRDPALVSRILKAAH